MNYEDFVKFALEENRNNIIKPSNNYLTGLPAFYEKYDFVRVYLEFNENDIHFIPLKEMNKYKQEYYLIDADFIIATSNSDPIYIKSNKVYMCPHGVKEPKPELLFNSFDDFLEEIYKSKRR